ncbi:MAG: hypothetical protein U5L00_04775 [Desulfovermiculus sp.]|nr:hypothetical protein [Desulfovermiculus sp.]
MNRQARLQHARSTNWLATYRGKDVIKGYCKWFAVDPICALTELRMLGSKISEEKEAEIRKTFEDKTLARRRQKEAAAQKEQETLCIDSDDTFAFIAGYTSGGAVYGIEWEDPELNSKSLT